MDFVYNDVIEKHEASSGSQSRSKEPADPTQTTPDVTDTSVPNKTEEFFGKLEKEVEKQYQKTTDVLKRIVGEDEYLEMNIPVDGRITEKAHEVLKRFDNNIQNMENIAQDYWNQVSKGSFWSSFTDSLSAKITDVVKLVETESNTDGLKEQNDGNVSDLKQNAVVGGNRTDSELKLLSTDKNIYLNFEYPETHESISSFSLDDNAEEIASLLTQNQQLNALVSSLVPDIIPAKTFWGIYYFKRNKILEMEKNRKTLIRAFDSDDYAKEQISWDDEEDDDDDANNNNNTGEKSGKFDHDKKIPREDQKEHDNGEKGNCSNEGNDEDQEDDEWE